MGIYDSFWDTYYGNQRVDWGGLNLGTLASGQVWGTNPPYTLTDFLAVYPKFFGPATAVTGTTVAPPITASAIEQGSTTVTVASAAGISDDWTVSGIGIAPGTTVASISGLTATLSLPALTNATSVLTFADPVGSIEITGLSSIAGMAAGQLITGPGIAGGTLIVSASGTTAVLSQPVTASGTGSFNFCPAPWLPAMAIQLYINLAQSSLSQARYFDGWPIAMGLFVAHYCTMFMRSESGTNTTAAQIALSGMQMGITVSKSVGDVSTSSQLIGDYADWGAWGQTGYGTLLVTMAKGVSMGPIWVR